jgi:hypothetical protein
MTEGRAGPGERPLVVAVPEPLQRALGADGAPALVSLLNEVGLAVRASVTALAVERFERRLAEELGRLRAELHEHVSGLRAEFHAALHAEVGSLRAELHEQVGTLRAGLHEQLGSVRAAMLGSEARITRWMFVFWVGQIGALLGILFAFFR